tara:strand:+ start:419 stop:595 length:177 start_codon:yes stop_codon:yes gene_type:complete
MYSLDSLKGPELLFNLFVELFFIKLLFFSKNCLEVSRDTRDFKGFTRGCSREHRGVLF